MTKVNLAQKFGLINEYWSPKIAGQLNGQYVKLAKFKGEFLWHRHEMEDELFLVTKGRLTIQLRDGDVMLGEGEFLIVPAGVEHRPVAEDEVRPYARADFDAQHRQRGRRADTKSARVDLGPRRS